jgi:hypothetical protein
LNISNSSISINTVVTKEKTYFEDSDGDEVTDSDEETEEVPDISGVAALANAVKDMRALSTFTFSGDCNLSKPVTMETTMTEANFSGKKLGVSGSMMVAAFLPKCQ